MIIKGSPKFQWTNSVIVFDGNSITAGYGLTGGQLNFAEQLALIAPFSSATFHNVAVSGQNTQDMNNDATSQVDVLFPVNGRGIVFAWEMTNDILSSGLGGAGATLQQSYDHFLTYCQARRAVGWKIIVPTLLKRGQPDPFNANLDTLNTMLMANWPSFCDVLIDTRSHIGWNDYTYLPDQVHPNYAGHTDFCNNLLMPAMFRVPKTH